MIRIILVDDQKIVREAIKSVLKLTPDLEVVGTASNGEEAIAQVGKLHPNIVLMDIEMPGLDGIAATRSILQQFSGVRVIVLSMHDEDHYVAQAVRAGAMGYLVKNTSTQELEEVIRSVNNGYVQIGSGLSGKVTTVSAEPVANRGNHNGGVASVSVNQKIQKSQTKKPGTELLGLTLVKDPSQKKLSYLRTCLVGNIVLWSASLLYLKSAPPIYHSSWTVSLPETASSTSIKLPDIEQAFSQNQSLFSNSVADPRENYKLIATSEDVVKPAAASLKMTIQEFGKPKVEILDNTTSMKFSMEGSTPEESRAKAIAIHQAFKNDLARLKKIESNKPDQNTSETLKNAQLRMEKARQELTEYQASTGLNSQARVENLDKSIDQMRVDLAQLTSQQEQIQRRTNQLLQELKLSPEKAQDAINIHSDGLFKQYLAKYNQIEAELVNLEVKYLPSHPIVIAEQQDSQAAKTVLLQRASFLLGQSTDLNDLNQMGLTSNDNQNNSQKDNLLGELINSQAERQGLDSQVKELKQQITQLETKQRQRSRFDSELNKLEKNKQISEALYSSLLTKLEIDKTNTANMSPPILLLTQPSLPVKPSSPNTLFVLIGSAIGSFLLTTSFLSLSDIQKSN
jgi:DNA-binding NarL/FixJ family response regulator/uncharacterized protein involved in exopolysaccharide biosynthesis